MSELSSDSESADEREVTDPVSPPADSSTNGASHPQSNGSGPKSLQSLAERLSEEMTQRWRAGDHAQTEEYLARHPELAQDPEAALELVCEEIFLRQEFGQPISREQLKQRFPQWATQLQKLLDFHQALQPAAPAPRFPRSGELWCGFRLRAELGRGARGRVFVATQPALGDRPIVLKLSALEGKEHLSLARLQHTNIVPLYAVQNDDTRHLRALCMPYFGGATLRQILDILHGRPLAQRKGQDLVQALEKVRASAREPVPVGGPSCAILARMSYVHAICWIGACLADALHYAEEHDLVHLDLKPANVLLGADGQPMLLDFHLARAPIHPDSPPTDWLGGTSGYMAPEQQAALEALKAGQKISGSVDGRADVYSLGVVLYEALAGILPAAPPVPLRKCNPRVSQGLSDLIEKCLVRDPENRMSTAAALATDLRRHMADLPLRSVANRSLVERWSKWRRRRPQAILAFLLLLFVATALTSVWIQFQKQSEQARNALRQGNQDYNQGKYEDAASAFGRGLALARGIPLNGLFIAELERKQQWAEKSRLAQEWHAMCGRLRLHYRPGDLSKAELHRMEQQCKALWRRRLDLLEPGQLPIAVHLAQHIDSDVKDLALLWTDLRLQLAENGELEIVGPECLAVLDEVEQKRFTRRTRALWLEREAVAIKLKKYWEWGAVFGNQKAGQDNIDPRGQAEYYANLAKEAAHELKEPNQSTESIDERCTLAGLWLSHDKVESAERELRQIIEDEFKNIDPDNRSPWPYFYEGQRLLYFTKDYHQAEIAFGRACDFRENDPDSAACFYYMRARARAELGQVEDATLDYNHAIAYDPKLVAAYLHLSRLQLRQRDYRHALENLQRALENKADPVLFHLEMASCYSAQSERKKAWEQVRLALRANSKDPQAQKMQAALLASALTNMGR